MKGEIKFTDAPFVEASKKLQQLIDINAFQKGYTQMTPQESNELFFAGKIAIYPIGSWLFNPAIEFLGDDLGYFPFPMAHEGGNYTDASTVSSDGVANGMMVAKKTKYPEEAAKFAVVYSRIVNDLKVKAGQPSFIKTDAVPDKEPHPAYKQFLEDVNKVTHVQQFLGTFLPSDQSLSVMDVIQAQFAGTVPIQESLENYQKIVHP